MFAALLLPLFAAGEHAPDRVTLNDGTRVDGRVVVEDDKSIVVRNGSHEREFPRAEVKEVVSLLSSWREAQERWHAAGPAGAEGALDVASYCERVGLPGEARLLRLRALYADPMSTTAHELLGHEKDKKTGRWLVKLNGKRVLWEDVVALHPEWSNAFELPTLHFALKTNLPLRDAIDAALDLENVYAAVMQALGNELRFRDVVEPMRAEIHADDKSFPDRTHGIPGYYDAATRTLFIDAHAGLDVGLLVHEATHQILDAVAAGTRNSRALLPAWLDEGIAEWFRACVDGGRGRLEFVKDGLDRARFRVQAASKNTYDLARLLSFDSEDFQTTNHADLKYAEAYTFVHFLISGEGGVRRERFLAFMRNVLAGRASKTDLLSALGEDAAALERAWLIYVRATAG